MAADGKFPFKCSNCGESFSFDELAYAIFKYGQIFLIGNTKCYFGYNCVKCDKPTTNIHRLNFREWQDCRNNISKGFKSLNLIIELVYDSFPYYNYILPPLPKPIDAYSQKIPLGFGSLSNLKLEHHIKDSNILKNAFCSYSFGSPAFGPAITYWFYNEKDLHHFITYENDTGNKVFPRHIKYEPFIDRLIRFCWDNRIGYSEMIPLKEGIRYMAEINIAFLDLFPGYHREDNPSGVPEYDLITVPDTISGMYVPPMRRKIIKAMKSSNISEQDISEQDMFAEVWKKFHKIDYQEVLAYKAEKFIEECISLSKKVHCNYDDYWILREQYLIELYEAAKVPKKMKIIKREKSSELQRAVEKIESQFPEFSKIISKNDNINKCKKDVFKVAQLKGKKHNSLLITGETGTGKELFAKAFYAATGRRGSFESKNMAAIPEKLLESELFGYKKGSHGGATSDSDGLFKRADRCVLFLDEIGEVEYNLQAKLLRVLGESTIEPIGGRPEKVDVKIAFATNKDLSKSVKNKTFRNDLYNRINTFEIVLPPLRERTEDIEPLIKSFVEKISDEEKNKNYLNFFFNEESLSVLKDYPWDGNVRELENLVSKVILNWEKDSYEIYPADLPSDYHHQKQTIPPLTERRKKQLPGDDEFYKLVEIDKIPKAEIARMYNYTRPYISKVYHERIKPKFKQKDS